MRVRRSDRQPATHEERAQPDALEFTMASREDNIL